MCTYACGDVTALSNASNCNSGGIKTKSGVLLAVHSSFQHQLRKQKNKTKKNACRNVAELCALHGAQSDVTAHLWVETESHLLAAQCSIVAALLAAGLRQRPVFTWSLSTFTARAGNLQSAVHTRVHALRAWT